MLLTGIDEIVANRILSNFAQFKDKWMECIEASFVSDNQKEQFKALIEERLGRLNEQ